MRELLARGAAWLRKLPVAIAAGLVVLLVLGSGIAIIFQSEAGYLQQKSEATRVQAEILAASVVAALDFGDAAAAQEAADAMRVNGQIRGVAIFDRQGRRIAGYRRDHLALAPTLAESRARGRTSPAVIADVPVISAGERIGTVRLSTDPQPVATRVGRYIIIALLVIMAALVVAVLGLAQVALRRANQELEARAGALAEANAELTHQIGERAKAEDQ